MFERVEYKLKAKVVLKKNYWVCFLASLIVMLLNGNTPEFKFTYSSPNSTDLVNEGLNWIGTPLTTKLIAWFSIIGGIAVVVALLGWAFKILVLNVMDVGLSKYYLEARKESYEIKHVIFAFQSPHYWNVVKVVFFQNLQIFLWTLLFIIPGIIKSYQLRFIPYILAENPGMEMDDVFALAKDLSKDIKMDLFIMDLSFLGWSLLASLTFGIGQFFLHPYTEATNAEAYAAQLHRIGSENVY